MSVEQVVFALAGAVCIAASVTAVTARDARGAAGALLATLLSVAILYALLSAPIVAGAVIIVALFLVVPATVHFTVPAPRAHPDRDAGPIAGAAMVICAPLLAVLGLTIAAGEMPLNVSVRSTDGYDVGAFGGLVAAHYGLTAAAAVVLVLVALGSARTASRGARR